jgi:hypothetical protein
LLTVDNDIYGFTIDATGLQTFPELYSDGGVPLGHLSNWTWHTAPNPEGYRVEKFPLTNYCTLGGRPVIPD